MAIQQCRFPWHNLNDNKPGDPNTLRLLKAALAAVSPVNTGLVTVEHLVTGLPVNLFFTQKTELEGRIRSLDGTTVRAQVGARRVDIILSVKNVKLIPQPYGSMLDVILDSQARSCGATWPRGAAWSSTSGSTPWTCWRSRA